MTSGQLTIRKVTFSIVKCESVETRDEGTTLMVAITSRFGLAPLQIRQYKAILLRNYNFCRELMLGFIIMI